MVAALIVGGLTAWYLGLRAGGAAAVLTIVALIVASVVPGLTVAVYALVIAWVGALYFLGPKIIGGPAAHSGLPGILSAGFGQAQRWSKKWRDRPKT